MQSIKTLYKIGVGPSSSHTMGPAEAAKIVLKRHPDADVFWVTLFNSLALTGEGHLTDLSIERILKGKRVEFKREVNPEYHPNLIRFSARKEDGSELGFYQFQSIGGGDIHELGTKRTEAPSIYPHTKFEEIKKYCKKEEITLYEYILRFEDKDFPNFLEKVYSTMEQAIERGLSKKGVLPGPLKVQRKAPMLLEPSMKNEPPEIEENRLVSAYAFAVSEENASGGLVVTAPTCGASGVVPAVLYYMVRRHKMIDRKRVLEGLAVAGLFGVIIRENASISGAVAGCQAEIGSATAMAAAAHATLFKLSIDQVEYAAEVALEHSLGLTCDPVGGYVQIPCIERNAVGALRAINACGLSFVISDTQKIPFDTVVETMYQTGLDMDEKYKETACGGLAYFYRESKPW